MVVVGVNASTEEGDDEEEDATSTSAAANVDALHFIIYLFLLVYYVSLLRSKLQTSETHFLWSYYFDATVISRSTYKRVVGRSMCSCCLSNKFISGQY